jgi:nicotinate-nucleotide adenylyltransferase
MRVGVLGGSFNPIHIGHLRLVIETRERLGLDRVDLVPSAQPPHKPAAGLLPFDLRRRLLELAISAPRGLPGLDGLRVNPLEAERVGPSYTYDTLRSYRRSEPDSRLFFILGGGDLLTLPEWRRGLELVTLADFVIVPRDQNGREDIADFVRRTWPQARPLSARAPFSALWRFTGEHGETRLGYLPLPRIETSSSQIREAWRAGSSLRFLVPEAVERELRLRRAEIDAVWREEER